MDVVYALITAVLFAAVTVAVRLGLQCRPASPLALVAPPVIAFLVTFAVALISLPFRGAGDLVQLWRFLLAGLISPGLSQIVLTRAIREAGASRVGILFGTAPVLSAVLAIALLDEPFRAVLAVATALIVVGGIALAWEPGRPAEFTRVGLAFGVACAFLFAVQAVVIRWAADGTGASPFFGTVAILGSGTLLLLAYVTVTSGRAAWHCAGRVFAAFLPAGLAYALSYVGFNLAYERGRVTVVAPLTATESVWTVVLAALLIGRRRDAIGPRVVAASLLVVAGGVLVGGFR